jgi:hypothetical protein
VLQPKELDFVTQELNEKAVRHLLSIGVFAHIFARSCLTQAALAKIHAHSKPESLCYTTFDFVEGY